MSTRTTCPECGKKLAVRDELAGKKIKCPACAAIFTATLADGESAAKTTSVRDTPAGPIKEKVTAKPPLKRPVPVEANDSDKTSPKVRTRRGEDDEDRPVRRKGRSDDHEDDEERPVRGRRQKSARAAGSGMLGVWIAAAGLAVVLLGVGIWFFAFRDTGGGGHGGGAAGGGQAKVGSNQLGAAAIRFQDMVPDDAWLFLSVDAGSDLVAAVFSAAADSEALGKLVGVPGGDLERITVFSAMPADEAKKLGANPIVVLVQAKKAIDKEKVKQAELLRGVMMMPEEVNDQTMIIGDPRTIQRYKSLNNRGKPTGTVGRALNDAIKSRGMAAAIVVPPEFVQQAPAALPQQVPFLPPIDDKLQKVKSLYLSAELSDQFRLSLSIDMNDAAAAAELEKGARELVNLGKGALVFLGKTPELHELKQFAERALNDLKITTQGNEVGLVLETDAKAVRNVLNQLGEMAQKTRTAAGRIQATNNFKQIALAWHNYADAHGSFPPQTSSRGLSWRVMILPYIEQEQLYRQFKLDEPWDSPHNKKLIPLMPAVFALPDRPAPPGSTYIQTFVGPNTINADAQKGLSFRAIRDGTSNTLLIAEAESAVEWTRPADIEVRPDGPIRLGASSPNGTLAAFCDGAVRIIPRSVTQQVLRWLIDPRDGNVIPNF
ncbi:MAG: DUF1559 domain-containing protein [Gemmataceae bacterium]|nr:DUF1559 domain-containing protein [Gemmataceae bacterium]